MMYWRMIFTLYTMIFMYRGNTYQLHDGGQIIETDAILNPRYTHMYIFVFSSYERDVLMHVQTYIESSFAITARAPDKVTVEQRVEPLPLRAQ